MNDAPALKKVVLERLETSDEGTFGKVTLDDGTVLCSGELPWRDNKPDVSCIPLGIYRCVWAFSPKHARNVYHVVGVKGRTSVEIHAANFCGDESKGYKADLLGCITLGEETGPLNGQKAILSSKPAIKELEDHMGGQTFELRVTETACVTG